MITRIRELIPNAVLWNKYLSIYDLNELYYYKKLDNDKKHLSN